jgi:hypothetical protein
MHANNIGVGTHKLSVNDEGAELRVYFLKRNCQKHNYAKKNLQKNQFAKKLAISTYDTVESSVTAPTIT